MKCKIVKLESLSGEMASIYSVVLNDEKHTLFENFIFEHINSFKTELSDILKRLRTIGNKTGAREIFFKPDEGKPGDGVCALYDVPNKKLRLYCIRYGTTNIILGGGGEKPKNIRKLQDSKKLKDANYILREISEEITLRIKSREILFSYESDDLTGNLEFNTDDDEQ